MLARLLPLVLFLVAVGGCSAVPSAPSERQRAEAAAATLLALAATPDAGIAEFAPLIVSRSDDPTRRWLVPADATRPREADGVRSVAASLRGLLARVSQGGRFGYAVEAFSIQQESEGAWSGLTLRFDDADSTRVVLGFLPVGGRLLLGDID